MRTNEITLKDGIDRVRPEDFPRVVEVWEESVRPTHLFLTESDIQSIKPHVQAELEGLSGLACVRDGQSNVVAFVGWKEGKIEALFVHPSWHRAGIGKRLVEYAMNQGGSTLVDVNEENKQALAFYLHIGFCVESRSALDGMGMPFPLLHLKYKPA